MTDPDAIRSVAREVLAELLSETRANGNGHGDDPVVPQVPPPPVAAVLRPSTWAAPPVPGELVGPAGHDCKVEAVSLHTDEDLERFVHGVLGRADEIRAGRLRFTLQTTAGAAAAESPAALHVAKGAVTERAVREAAAQGTRIVLGRRAVLTPLARDTARKLGVEIEKEAPC
jgi:hypothetical protein